MRCGNIEVSKHAVQQEVEIAEELVSMLSIVQVGLLQTSYYVVLWLDVFDFHDKVLVVGEGVQGWILWEAARSFFCVQ